MARFATAAAAFGLALGLGAPDPVLAQGPAGGMREADCDQLARMPNPPMTPEACRNMVRSARAMEEAMATPGGERDGDEAMTCAEIEAEMRTLRGVGIAPETAAEAEDSARDLKDKVDDARSEGRSRTNPDPAMAEAQTRATDAAAASMEDLAADMRANPRLARLIRLGGEKNCRMGG